MFFWQVHVDFLVHVSYVVTLIFVHLEISFLLLLKDLLVFIYDWTFLFLELFLWDLAECLRFIFDLKGCVLCRAREFRPLLGVDQDFRCYINDGFWVIPLAAVSGGKGCFN